MEFFSYLFGILFYGGLVVYVVGSLFHRWAVRNNRIKITFKKSEDK